MFRRIINYILTTDTASVEPEPIAAVQVNTPRTILSEKQIRTRSRSFDDKYENVKSSSSYGECPICLLDFNDNDLHCKRLKCNHLYHESCIKNWVVYKNKQTCPMCNNHIQGMNEAIVKG